MHKTTISNGRGRNNLAEVDSRGNIHTIQTDEPPLVRQLTRPFVQYLTDDGTSTGDNDMGVDGSSTTATFYVSSSDTADRYIKGISVVIGYGTAAQPWEWADAAAALTNGIRGYYQSTAGDQELFVVKSNSDFLRFSNDSIIPTAWELRHLGAANDYGYLLDIDFTKISPKNGIKLDKATTQTFAMDIRDNVGSTADTFNVLAYGFERFE
jgi:hypothetical protein